MELTKYSVPLLLRSYEDVPGDCAGHTVNPGWVDPASLGAATVTIATGEEPRPLEKVASGGELSRIALALKTCATGSPMPGNAPRTLVFDEVDAGVGGGAAEAVGRRLKRLAASNQVLCVTHLPQIAGFADHHYSVSKRELGGRTLAAVEELDIESRRREIGRMLSGERITPEALRHAEQLMSVGQSAKSAK